jgi:hypothetical protein
VEELIFFAVIIFFSIIESIARSRKQRQQGGGGAPGESFPGLPDTSEWEQRLPDRGVGVEDLPTYDEEPSYDERFEPRSREDRARPHRPSSEEMLPGDLLEELSRMAGRVQQREARTLELPKESPPLPEAPVEPEPVRRRTPPPMRERPVRVPAAASRVQRPVPGSGRPEHRVHLAHSDYGTDPSSRAPSFHDTLDPLAERLSEDARAVRKQLRSRDTGSLRRAFILREVLGEPLGMRD